MTNDNILRMRELIDLLNRASDAYYNGRGEAMTDYEWDAKFDELKHLEEITGITLPDSPTTKVSEDNISGGKEAHEYSALSLAKTKQPAELVKWAEGRPIWISWKLDGMTLVVTYDEGKLTKIVTRGNGHIGTNVTHIATAINGVPQTIKTKSHTVIRGEAVISYEDFNRFCMESDEEYANPRNLTSGSITLKDTEEIKQRHIRWIPFTLVHTDDDTVGDSWGERMEWLEAMGMNVVEHERIDTPDLGNITAVIDRWTEMVTNRQNPYPVDGLVITYDDTAYAETGSVTGHHATKAGYAFKWQDETAQTVLEDIEWSCAASKISPVAIFRPVELEGTTVKRASLCNISECKRLGIGGPGTEISVIKANKIIPKVIEVTKTAGEFTIPEHCPVCGSTTRIEESEISGTQTLHCTNPLCPAKQLKKFARFVSKEGMNIDGISEQTISKFINLGWITDYSSIYDLRDHILEISVLEGFGQKSASNIVRSVEKSRNVEAQKLLYALNIPLCGADVCKRLLAEYPLKELIALAASTETDDYFAHIAGIGPEKSASFINWFKDARNMDSVARLLEMVNVSQAEQQPKGSKCNGMTFVVTGDVHHYKNRNELKAYIESQGGKVTGSVSKSTTYLINNDITSTSGKNKKALELGIEIITEDDFISRFGQ